VIRDLETARDEAEKARAIIVSFIEANVGGMARELAAQDSDNSNDMNG
jgi:hypothetical protein